MAVNYTSARFSAEDDNGRPLSGGRLFTYQNGTTTPAVTYKDAAGTTPNTNPIILDARGEAIVFLQDTQVYRFVLQNRVGSLVWSQDGITGNASSSSFLAFIAELLSGTGAALIGFIQTGVGAVRRSLLEKMRDTLDAKDYGVVGDWNGTTGTDNSAALLNGIKASAATGKKLRMNVQNVGVQCLNISALNNWSMEVNGSMYSLATKPAAGATDEKDTAGGVAPLIKVDNCTGFSLAGRFIDPRYREAFWITNCSNFDNSLEVRGQGMNDNLTGALYRYCTDFRFGQSITAATRKPATSYYQWCNAVTVWDCSNFVVTSNYVAKSNGGNGLYIGSNCKDFVVEDGSICTLNAMSGVQLAWSSFGAFPYRFTIGAMILNGNRADGIDVNNTDPANPIMRIDGKFLGHVCVNNGYNDDGTVSADGSGLGTFMNVSHFEVDGASSTDSARAGFYAKNCTNFYASGFVSKQKSTNNLGEGIYLEKCSRYEVDIDVITHPNQEALKTFGVHRDGIIGGNISGVIAISDPDASTSYDNVKLVECNIETIGSVIGNVEIEGGSIRSTGTALYARKNVTNCTVTAGNGIALIYSAPGVKVRGGRYVGSNSGTNCTNHANCTLSGAYVEGNSGPASHWINTPYPQITDNAIVNTGGANSLRTEASVTNGVKFGNVLTGPFSIAGTFDINF